MSHAPFLHLRSPSQTSSWQKGSLFGVPTAVRELVRIHLDEEAVKLCVSSNFHPDGSFGESWLILSKRQLFILALEKPGWSLLYRFEISGIQNIVTRALSGGHAVMLRKDGLNHDIFFFANDQAALYGKVIQKLQKLISDEESEAEFQELIDKERAEHCPKCRRAFEKNTQVCPHCFERGSIVKRVLVYARPYRLKITWMIALMLGGLVLELMPPQIMRILLDDVLVNPSKERMLLPMVGLLAAIMVAQRVFEIMRGRVGIWVGTHIGHNIQKETFTHLQKLSLSYFHKQQTGGLMSRVNNDTQQMIHFLVDGIQYSVVNVLMLIGATAILLWMNPFLGTLVLLPAPLVILISGWCWKRLRFRFTGMWRAMANVSSYINDALTGVRVTKVFGQESREVERFDQKIGNLRDVRVDAETSWFTMIPLLNLIVQSSVLLVWYFGAHEVYGKNLSIGELLAFVTYLGMLYGPLQLLTRLNDWLSRSLTAAARVFEVLDTKPEVMTVKDAKVVDELEGSIAFKSVSFGYEKHKPVLKKLDLNIEKGTMVGLVGHSGAGKSTVINLVGRLFDVDEGKLLIDGRDIRDYRLEDLRRNIGYVLQDNFLFNASVAENIAYGKPEASRREIIEAAMAANAHEFIMKLSDGYDTVVGERGIRLSGGEAQRVSIARALLQNPKVLILDEATSAVDTETEAKIQAALNRLIKDRTTIAIAHRLSTLRNADKLVVMKDGEVSESGTHDELMKLEGEYYKLVSIQSEWSRTIGLK